MSAASSGAAPAPAPAAMVNLNVGVLGHVDCGKTSLVKALSTRLSTASIDKHPQSQERGITLDLVRFLGGSSFLLKTMQPCACAPAPPPWFQTNP